MSERKDILKLLRAATSDADVLAAFAKTKGQPAIPTLAALEKWYPNCLESVKNEVQARLRALWPHRPLQQYDLFPAQRSLSLLSSDEDISPFGVTGPFLRAWEKNHSLRHPWAILVKSWQEHCPLPQANLIIMREPKPPNNRRVLELNRAAAMLQLATLAVVEVDGAPFASDVPLRPGTLQRYEVVRFVEQRDLDPILQPHPKTIQGRATAGALVEALANLDLTGDERSKLRGDILRLGEIAYALTRTVHISEADGAILLSGRNTPAARRRFNRALWGLRALRVQAGEDGVFYALADAEPGLVNALGPPRWWSLAMSEQKRMGRGRKRKPSDKPLAYRLSGGVFRRLSFGRARHGGRGPEAGASGHLGKTIAGIEAALTWGRTPGRGKDARTPGYVTPLQTGRHGEDLFFPAWQILRVSGENVTPDSMDNTAQQRYRRRAQSLRDAGYFLERKGQAAADAGDTIEIVEQRKGSKIQEPGLVVRATARFCHAYAKGTRVRVPADRLLIKP